MEQMQCESAEECESWLSFFKTFDTDNDGRIPVNELIVALRYYQGYFQLTDAEIHQLVNEGDLDHDRLIDFREFTLMMCKAKQFHLTRLAVFMGNAVVPRHQQQEATNYLLQYTFWPPPLVIILLSTLEVVFYLYDAFSSGYGLHPDSPAPIWSPLILNPYKRHFVYQYFTYIFVHVGYAHLLSNLAMQLVLGVSLELVHKGLRIGGLFLGGALMGSLLFGAFDRYVYLAGASGGVYALLTAHLADVVLNWSEMPFRWIRVVVFSLFVLVDFGHAAYQRFISKAATKIAVTSHIGGAIAGLLLGIVLLRNLRSHKWEVYIWYAALVAWLLLVAILAVLNVAPVTLSG